VRLFIHGAAFDDALDQIRGETNMSSSELYFCVNRRAGTRWTTRTCEDGNKRL